VKWLIERGAAALFWDPGLGKTSVALTAHRMLMEAGAAGPALVVAPLRPCYAVWSHAGELGAWTDFAGVRVALLHGARKAEAALADADLYVVNYDGLRWLADSGALAGLLSRGVDTLVLDELSKVKRVGTQRFRKLWPHLPRFRRRWGLTGSPTANGYLDLFGQAKALDLGRALGPTFWRYRLDHFYPTGYQGYVWVPKPGAEDAIAARLEGLAHSARAEDHLDLPELVERELWVDLPEAARELYDRLEDDFVAAVGSGEVTAVNAAAAAMKCRQVAAGGVYLDGPGREVGEAHQAKVDALEDLVDELQGSPLLVSYEFRHDLERVRARLGAGVPDLGGDARRATALAEQFRRGELPVLCGHPASVAHGLNLQGACHHVCFFSPTYNMEHDDQLVRRVYRQGATANRVFVHRILARRTLDQDALAAVRAKRRGQAHLFRALAGGALTRSQDRGRRG
jgi:SNF2 family DNA or RNA helicase